MLFAEIRDKNLTATPRARAEESFALNWQLNWRVSLWPNERSRSQKAISDDMSIFSLGQRRPLWKRRLAFEVPTLLTVPWNSLVAHPFISPPNLM